MLTALSSVLPTRSDRIKSSYQEPRCVPGPETHPAKASGSEASRCVGGKGPRRGQQNAGQAEEEARRACVVPGARVLSLPVWEQASAHAGPPCRPPSRISVWGCLDYICVIHAGCMSCVHVCVQRPEFIHMQ